MNPALWALTAAREGRKKGLVPGSSTHIVEETAFNLRATKDAKALIQLLAETSFSSLNEIIHNINSDASFQDLQGLIQHSQPPPQSPIEDSFRSMSSISRSDQYSIEPSAKPELLVQNGEKHISLSASSASGPTSHYTYNQSSITPLPEAPFNFQPPSTVTLPKVKSPKHMHPSKNCIETNTSPPDDGVKVKMEFTNNHISSKKAHVRPSTSSKACVETPEIKEAELGSHSFVKKTSDNLEQTGHKQPHETDFRTKSIRLTSSKPTVSSAKDPNTFSPIRIVNGRVASPDFFRADSPSDHIAPTAGFESQTGSRLNKGFELNESEKSGDDADNSFQAISTAIRKSFAGKTSMGHHSGRPSLYNDAQADVVNSPQNSMPYYNEANSTLKITKFSIVDPEKVQVKQENDSDSVKAPLHDKRAASRPKSPNTSLYSGVVFISLPNKEPIKLHSVNQVQSGNAGRQNQSLSSHVSINSKSPTNTKSSQQPAELQPRSGDAFAQHSLTHTKEPYSTRQVPKLFSEKLFPKISPPVNKLKKSPVKQPRESPKRFMSPARNIDRSHSRTTSAGSPVRRNTSSRPFSTSKPTFKAQNFSPHNRLAASSSANSSRSPTKFSQMLDGASIKGSPTSFLIHEVHNNDNETKKDFLENKTQLNAAPSKDIKASSSDKEFLKNRFLTKALLPDNTRRLRKLVHPDNVQNHAHKAGTLPNYEPSKSADYPGKFNLRIRSGIKPSDVKPASELSSESRPKNTHDLMKTMYENVKKEIPKLERSQRNTTKSITSSVNQSHNQVIPKKRAVGNAVPLPDAARGKFKKDSTAKALPRDAKDSKTPLKLLSVNPRFIVPHSQITDTPPSALPDIPSDDDLLRTTRNVKSWASTPEILRSMKEKLNLDPKIVFGECADLNMEDLFRSVKGQSTKSPTENFDKQHK